MNLWFNLCIGARLDAPAKKALRGGQPAEAELIRKAPWLRQWLSSASRAGEAGGGGGDSRASATARSAPAEERKEAAGGVDEAAEEDGLEPTEEVEEVVGDEPRPTRGVPPEKPGLRRGAF